MFFVNGQYPTIEKDSEIEKLCTNAWSQMRDVAMPHFPVTIAPDAIAFVSFEDALKELAELKKQGIC
jgi:hypothetical protein